MNCFDIGNFGGTDDTWYIEITFRTISRPYTNGLICKLQVWRIFISLGIYYYCFNAKLMAGANDTQCYFATICYQNP